MLCVIELAQCFFFLLLELSDARRFFNYRSTFYRSALDNIRDLALCHNAVTIAPDAGAHEELLHIAQSAASAIEKIFAATITENASRDGNFVEIQIHPSGAEVRLIHIANGE